MGRTYICGFCDEQKDREKERPEYIYPVPLPGEVGQTSDNREGRNACPPCAVEQKMLQQELGLTKRIERK